MIITESELIKQKHNLIKQADAEKNEKKKEAIDKQIGKIEKQIYQQAISNINNIAQGIKSKEIKQSVTLKELRQILNAKYTIYQQAGKDIRHIYTKIVAKKREGKQILELMKKDKNRKAIIEHLSRY